MVNEIDQNRVQTKAATIPQSASQVYASGELEALFRATFFHSYDTLLEGGAAEPVYLPGHPHRICYTRDYFRSALHEIAHWCVAGPARRQQEDYGYWYAPDGRSADQQAEFSRVEVLPQAYEAIFCAACGHDFRVSLDNLNGDGGDEAAFAVEVKAKAERLLVEGLAERPARWCEALATAYGREDVSLHQALQLLFS
ncbi:elongation factor P hydroxylase [Alcanivorax sp.]|uniref:elongation factor P hydroxylase n=1 Tax=Alcanivorax sp. TaxID=1872427 RepID=UPI000C44FBB5|nr:elongation factor P hydroxylase [Alcanivorax sp.]MBQ24256.1 ATPase [Alcanivorax sp.]